MNKLFESLYSRVREKCTDKARQLVLSNNAVNTLQSKCSIDILSCHEFSLLPRQLLKAPVITLTQIDMFVENYSHWQENDHNNLSDAGKSNFVDPHSLLDSGVHISEELHNSVRNCRLYRTKTCVDDCTTVNVTMYSFMKSDFQRHLAKWALMHKIPQIAVSALLRIHGRSSPHFDLLSDARTLLCVPRQAHIVDMKPETFFYSIQVSTDGLPIANSGGGQFWPLMRWITISTTVFSIGCYYGKSKPDSSKECFRASVENIPFLIKNDFLYKCKKLVIYLHSFICDILAKAFSLMIKGHMGYRSCTKCKIDGMRFLIFYQRRDGKILPLLG